jgi:hypothetical protein
MNGHYSELLEKAYEFAKQDCAGKDPSHDIFHVKRVAQLALVLAQREGVQDLVLVELGTHSFPVDLIPLQRLSYMMSKIISM